MSAGKVVLGLDAGGSGTKWVLACSGETLASGREGPVTAALLLSGEADAALAALRARWPAQPSRAHAGIPGLSAATALAQAAAGKLAQAFGLMTEQVTVESDLDLAYRAHFAPGEGILVYAGTGSIAYHVTAQGERIRAGGRGYRIGDDGGGASLGRAALRWATDALDEDREAVGPLAQEVAAITGGLDWDTLRAFTYAEPGASALARLAPAVGRAADQGDPAAQAMLQDAAFALARLGERVRGQVGRPVQMRATGGALRVSPLLTDELRRLLPGLDVQWRDHAQEAAQIAGGDVKTD